MKRCGSGNLKMYRLRWIPGWQETTENERKQQERTSLGGWSRQRRGYEASYWARELGVLYTICRAILNLLEQGSVILQGPALVHMVHPVVFSFITKTLVGVLCGKLLEYGGLS